MIKIETGPAPERYVYRQARNLGVYGHVHDAIERLKPGGWFEWTAPKPAQVKQLSNIRSKFAKIYPHIEIYYADKARTKIIVKHKPLVGIAPDKTEPPPASTSGPVSAPPAEISPPATEASGIYLPPPGRAQRITPSKSSDRWPNENARRSAANAAVIAANLRDPQPGVAPMRTFGGDEP